MNVEQAHSDIHIIGGVRKRGAFRPANKTKKWRSEQKRFIPPYKRMVYLDVLSFNISPF